MSGTTPYRHVKENQGGTLEFNEALPHIGTDGCVTCVGVYFPIDAKRCFCAHINAYVSVNDGRSTEYDILTTREGEEVKNSVLARLQKEASRSGWKAQDVVAQHPERVILVCPDLNRGERSESRVGHWVVEAFREFLGHMEGLLEVDSDSQGFVVNHETRENRRISSKGHGEGIDDGVFDGTERKKMFEKRVEDFDNRDEWFFVVERSSAE
ncbi:Hypothetical predicted protein [Lecanosticta acicola]|uniref:Uncharacterized protein n=1 Tax=Lecanosticta acicola TaxID=111012 RepID=A0AAI8YWL9_9PEZI|nr:Hypothetical predicted protein [Lecanosticta acicola]